MNQSGLATRTETVTAALGFGQIETVPVDVFHRHYAPLGWRIVEEVPVPPLPEAHVIAATAFVFPAASPGRGELDFDPQIDELVTDDASADRVAASITSQVLDYLDLDPKYQDGDEYQLAAIFKRQLATAARLRVAMGESHAAVTL